MIAAVTAITTDTVPVRIVPYALGDGRVPPRPPAATPADATAISDTISLSPAARRILDQAQRRAALGARQEPP